jgi:ribosomal protein S18 acetylase RimI-like enzyme
MQVHIIVKHIGKESFDPLLDLFHSSFGTVAKEFNLTKENNPTNGAFITKDQLTRSIDNGLVMYGYYRNGSLVGSVGYKQSSSPDEYYIEKLCVLDKYRHNGIGFDLLSFAENEVREFNGKIVSVGIINKNDVLKKWYIKNGYDEKQVLSYDHLPFEVCILKKELVE